MFAYSVPLHTHILLILLLHLLLLNLLQHASESCIIGPFDDVVGLIYLALLLGVLLECLKPEVCAKQAGTVTLVMIGAASNISQKLPVYLDFVLPAGASTRPLFGSTLTLFVGYVEWLQ